MLFGNNKLLIYVKLVKCQSNSY